MSRLFPLAWVGLGGVLVAGGLYAGGALDLGGGGKPAASAAAAPADAGLVLTPEQQKRGSVRVAALQVQGVTTERQGFARAIDASALAAIEAERSAAAAAVGVSQAEVTRLRALYAADQSASLRALEAARSQLAADRAKLVLAQRRVGLEFGFGLARLGPGGAAALVNEMVAGQAALLRIDLPGAPLAAGQAVRIGDQGISFMAQVLGPAAAADARLQTPGALAIVRGPAVRSLPVGRVLPAAAPDGAQKSGVFVPSAAIVRWQGSRWVYRQTAKGYERVELIGGEAVAGGWLVGEGLAAGDRIVVEGAETVLAVERGGHAA